ncbi:hypothetical protein [Mucilaginibacter agri]|uniref:DUF2846 domain-containing protein n=1 Tax=Mucilaginibacter agri TaxID=2695265 RepID=A0A966DTY8_9SPHI|nr:hypothetical protein [Mucilaginibacter agri]NCD71155.1 hypothetical protein [Mucilaginibacter agri]
MKFIKSLLSVALLTFICLSAYSQTPTGQIYFMRSTGYNGAAVNVRIYVDDQLVCKLKNNRFSIHDMAVGKHVVTVQPTGISNGKKSDPITVEVAEGKANYVNVVQRVSGYASYLSCEEVTQSSADNTLKKIKQTTDCGVTENK